jgi:hypothetical protein
MALHKKAQIRFNPGHLHKKSPSCTKSPGLRKSTRLTTALVKSTFTNSALEKSQYIGLALEKSAVNNGGINESRPSNLSLLQKRSLWSYGHK